VKSTFIKVSLVCFIAFLFSSEAVWSAGFSLRFFGNGTGDIDRVKIPIDNPEVPADIGSSDFTVEFWMKANPGDNGAGSCVTGNDGWINGNIIFDRDIFGPGEFGDYGISLFSDGIAFGIYSDSASAGDGICGNTNVANGQWHHIAVTRRFSDGRLQLYVDGVLDAEATTGPLGNISYQNNRPTTHANDPFFVIGAEKHDAGPSFPSYNGWIDEVRLSNNLRYTTNFTRPSSAFASDANTMALYHFDEGSGNAINDSSPGNSDGARNFGGSPAGPIWSPDKAPIGPLTLGFQSIITSGLTDPVAITHAPDNTGRIFITEQPGEISVWNGSTLSQFMDITGIVNNGCNEEGLLSIAFHPDYVNNGFFYVYYTDNSSNIQISRFSRLNANQGNPNSEFPILNIPHPGQCNHNGGQIVFGQDGYLYFGTGDGGGANDPNENGQNINTLLGKVLRIDVDGGSPYAIPPDNPFVGVAGLDEIWAYGLRNPWRFGFDRRNRDLFIADVGQNDWEEVDLERYDSTDSTPGGFNYGWNDMEGAHCFDPPSGCQMSGRVLPILEYGHSGARCSISGGYRYRGSTIPQIYGRYFYADYCTGEVWGASQNGSGNWSSGSVVQDFNFFISGFGEDQNGELYLLDHGGGDVYRFTGTDSNLSLTVTDTPDPVLVNQTLTYNVIVTNNGPANATGVSIVDELPAGVSFISASHPSCNHNSGIVTCNIGNVNNGANVPFTIVVMPTVPGTISNYAIAGANQNDGNATNNSDTESTVVMAPTGSDLGLSKTDGADPVFVGENITYTIQVTNNGPDNATGVTVTDNLPGSVTFVSASAGCNESSGTVTCTIGNLSASSNTSLQIVVTTTAAGSITNNASVDGNEVDQIPGNNSDSENTQVNDPTVCLLCDDFNDGVLSTEWTYVKTWNEIGGALTATAKNKSAEVLAIPIFSAGCSTCSIEVVVQNAGGRRNKIYILGWYETKNTLVELMMREDKDTWTLRQRVNKTIVAKKKANSPIAPGVNYTVLITFDGTTFEVFVDGVSMFTLPAVGVPSGTFGFRVKKTTGFFDSIVIN
jgi:uncharacterized repeat protein (TIGR01451 family)